MCTSDRTLTHLSWYTKSSKIHKILEHAQNKKKIGSFPHRIYHISGTCKRYNSNIINYESAKRISRNENISLCLYTNLSIISGVCFDSKLIVHFTCNNILTKRKDNIRLTTTFRIEISTKKKIFSLFTSIS